MTSTFEQLNPGSCKTYMLGNHGNDVAIVDPVLDELPMYISLLEKRGLRLTHVVETHTHADHISGAAALIDNTGATLVMHENAPAKCMHDADRIKNGQELVIAGVPVKFLFTPGHTNDSVSLIIPGKVLTGDALFLDDGGAGRDDLPGGDPGDHWETIQKFMALPESLVVYPAHDYRMREPSTLATQKRTNPHMQPRTREQFIDYITELKLGPADWMKDVLAANYACAMDVSAAWVPVDSSSCEVKGTLSAGVNEQEVNALTPRELKEMLSSRGGFAGPVLIDVRDAAEIKQPPGTLEGIINVPITQLASSVPSLEKYKDEHVVVICKIGGRSFTGAQILKQAGFKNVEYLEGGMVAWRNAFGA